MPRGRGNGSSQASGIGSSTMSDPFDDLPHFHAQPPETLDLLAEEAIAERRDWLIYCEKPGMYHVTLFVGPDGRIGLSFDKVEKS